MTATYDCIATTTLGSTAASISFQSISSSFTDLVLVFNCGAINGQNVSIRFNNDSGTNYSFTKLEGNGSSAGSSRSSNTTGGNFVAYDNPTVTISIFNYANTTTNKSFMARWGNAGNFVGASMSLWRSTAAINRVDLVSPSSDFPSGTTATLYGIKAE